MKKPAIIYEEETILVVKFNHPKCVEYLHYKSIIKIKDSGKNPIETYLKYDDIYPDMAPMPPEEHKIIASSVTDLISKLARWFRQHGYMLQ